MIRFVVHVIAKIFVICLFLFISIEIIDFDSSLISDYDRLALKVNNDQCEFYFVPKRKNDLYYYMACSGNRWWSNLDVKNDSIKVNTVLPGSLFLVEKRGDTLSYYDMIVDKKTGGYFLKTQMTNTLSIKEYVLYQVLKSIFLFVIFCISLMSTDIIIKGSSKPFFYFSIALSLAISTYFIFFYFFGYFYSYLFFGAIPSP